MRFGKFYFLWVPKFDPDSVEIPELLGWLSLIALQVFAVALFLVDLLLITSVHK